MNLYEALKHTFFLIAAERTLEVLISRAPNDEAKEWLEEELQELQEEDIDVEQPGDWPFETEEELVDFLQALKDVDG